MAPEPAPAVLACSGPFARDASEATLRTAFGAAQVSRAAISAGEDTTEPGTVLFADDPARRIEILWHDRKQHRRPALIRVGMPMGAGALWRIQPPDAGAIGVGTPLADVEAANGRPFTLSGFEWDYGGYVTDWRGGRLSRAPGGCLLSLRFSPAPDARDADAVAASGDRAFSSASSVMRAVKPVVWRIELQWPR